VFINQKTLVCTGPAVVKVPGVLVDRTHVLMKPVRSGMMYRLQTPSIAVFVFNGNKTWLTAQVITAVNINSIVFWNVTT